MAGEKDKKNGGAQVLACVCKANDDGSTVGAVWQDQEYGKGMRVHSKCSAGWRCTVCKRVK